MLKGKKLSPAPVQQKPGQLIELGTIDYHNLTADGKHGDFEAALQAAAKTGKPIFANFVEWSGCQVRLQCTKIGKPIG